MMACTSGSVSLSGLFNAFAHSKEEEVARPRFRLQLKTDLLAEIKDRAFSILLDLQ
jgi:hypothetical protein